MVFCNLIDEKELIWETLVTILILIDGFLQLETPLGMVHHKTSHNPYFNRWFSAI